MMMMMMMVMMMMMIWWLRFMVNGDYIVNLVNHRQSWSTARNLYMYFLSFRYRNILENVLITPEEVVEECLCVSVRNDMSH